ncbi:MAG: DUF7684 family protein [Burkholderiaceae bacterium]
MSDDAPRYLQLVPNAPLPPAPFGGPFRAVVVVRRPVGDLWRKLASEWLVAGGCRYMLAWGDECSRWDDAVDWAALEANGFADAPPERFVMTTWHDGQPLEAVFDYARRGARHPALAPGETWIVEVCDPWAASEPALRAQWDAGRDGD